MRIITRLLLFLALPLLAVALRAAPDPAVTESPARAASAKAAASQSPSAAASFGPVFERMVRFRGNESGYDLDTGKFINLSDNVNEQKVRTAGVDLYFSPLSNDLNRLAALDVLLVPLDGNAWASATPELVCDAISRLQKEQVPLVHWSATVVPGTNAFALLEGRAGRGETTVGVLQVLGAVGPDAKKFNGVGIRYKLVQPQTGTAALTTTNTIWGEPVDGVRVGLWADKSVWKYGEPMLLHASIINESGMTLGVNRHETAMKQVELDGKWYLQNEDNFEHTTTNGQTYVMGVAHAVNMMEPGEQWNDLKIDLGKGFWRKAHTNELDLTVFNSNGWLMTPQLEVTMPLFVGKHTFRLAVIAEIFHMGYQPVLRVTSNPVEVEIQNASPRVK